MQNAAPEHENELHDPKMGLAHEHDDDRERGVEHERAQTEEPDEDRPPVSNPLGEQVPGRMKYGRHQHESQREESHEIEHSILRDNSISAFQHAPCRALLSQSERTSACKS